MNDELLADGHLWLRIADPSWRDPLNPAYAMRSGGRWNPPGSFPALYVNEDVVTARLNLRHFIAGWPYEPEDLKDDSGPVLVAATLPRNQRVCDAHTPQGIDAVGLPTTYPLDRRGRTVPHDVCQAIGLRARQLGLRGVRCRCAPSPDGAGRELAWFPATIRSHATERHRLAYTDWFWS